MLIRWQNNEVQSDDQYNSKRYIELDLVSKFLTYNTISIDTVVQENSNHGAVIVSELLSNGNVIE